MMHIVPTNHFNSRLKDRSIPFGYEYIGDKMKVLCKVQTQSLILVPYNKEVYMIHAEEVKNEKFELITIYQVDYPGLYRDFMRLYMTKKHIFKHQLPFWVDKWKTDDKIDVLRRITTMKLENKLSKIEISNVSIRDAGAAGKVRDLFYQVVWDYRGFYLKELEIFEEQYLKYLELKNQNINIDSARDGKTTTFLKGKLPKQRLEWFGL